MYSSPLGLLRSYGVFSTSQNAEYHEGGPVTTARSVTDSLGNGYLRPVILWILFKLAQN